MTKEEIFDKFVKYMSCGVIQTVQNHPLTADQIMEANLIRFVKELGVEVEGPKSKLEEFRNFYKNIGFSDLAYNSNNNDVTNREVIQLKRLAEEAIKKLEEIINKMKNCENCNLELNCSDAHHDFRCSKWQPKD